MKHQWLIIAMALLFSACGGKSTLDNLQTQTDTTDRPITTTTKAVGVYQGNYSDVGLQFYAIVLPNDMYYAFEGEVVEDGSIATLWMLRTGQGKSNNGSYTAPITQFFGGEVFNLSLAANYVPATSLTGSIRFLSTDATHTFTAKALPASVLDFNSPASLSDIVGSWKAWGLCDILVGGPEGGCEPYTVTISATGDFLLSGWGWDCTFATITPDTANGFFSVKFAAGADTCFPAGAAGSGIAVEMLLPNGTRQLLLAIVGDKGAVAFAAQR